MLPWWWFEVVAAILLLSAIARAFHEVRIERDQATARDAVRYYAFVEQNTIFVRVSNRFASGRFSAQLFPPGAQPSMNGIAACWRDTKRGDREIQINEDGILEVMRIAPARGEGEWLRIFVIEAHGVEHEIQPGGRIAHGSGNAVQAIDPVEVLIVLQDPLNAVSRVVHLWVHAFCMDGFNLRISTHANY